MANAIYDRGRESFLKGELNWLSDNIKVVLVDAADYTVSLSTHQFLSDIPSAARVATSSNLSTKTATAGVADADDTIFIGATGDMSEALVIYQDTGTATSSRLIAYIDTATGLPIQPNTGDITVVWSNGSDRIFRL
jgi:hypothetical protein